MAGTAVLSFCPFQSTKGDRLAQFSSSREFNRILQISPNDDFDSLELPSTQSISALHQIDSRVEFGLGATSGESQDL